MEGYVHSVESAGTLDGPGVRFVVFLAGCPLSCLYCHNPDTWSTAHGRTVSVAALLREVRGYRRYLRRTGGGVTISGGEPLMQPGFAEALLEGCHEMGLHTALDTSGFLGSAATDSLLDATDLVLLDLKSGLPGLYERVTGGALQPSLDFARRLAARRQRVWVRFVLVPGLTDGAANIQAVARLVADMTNVERLEVLPFHKLGQHKWEGLGMKYALKDTPAPSPTATESVRGLFRAAGVAHVF